VTSSRRDEVSSSDLMRARSSTVSHEGRRKEMLSSASVTMTPYGVAHDALSLLLGLVRRKSARSPQTATDCQRLHRESRRSGASVTDSHRLPLVLDYMETKKAA